MTTITTAQANKILQAALFTEANRKRSFTNLLTEEAPKAAKGDKKGRTQSSPHAPIVRITDLNKTAGDEVSIDIVYKLNKLPTMGDRRLEGRGENLEFSDFSLKLNQGRHLVDNGGRMSQMRTKHELVKTGRTLLGTYFNDLQDQLATVHLAGARGTFNAVDTIIPLAEHREFNEIMVNDVTPPTFARHFFGGDATSVETLDTADIFSLDTINNMALYIEEMANPMQPVKLGGDDLSGDDPYFVCYVTPRQWDDWYNSTSGKDWQQMMSRVMNRSKGFNHPLFKGECAMWRNILIRKYSGMPIRHHAGSIVDICGNDLNATVKQVEAPVTMDRAILLGGQALANCYGVGKEGGHFSMHQEKVDHENGSETSIRWVNGLKKIRFRDREGKLQDNGVMAIDTAVSI